MRYKSGHLPNWKKAKHIPSGILIVWADKDNKIHTQSIAKHPALPPLGEKLTKIDAQGEMALRQLDCMGIGGYILPAPMMTFGLTRIEAKQALHRELASSPRLQTTLIS